MSRKVVALAAVALTGALLVVPDSTMARGGGMRGGGFHGMRGAAFFRHPGRVHIPEARVRANTVQFRHPVLPRLPVSLARTTVRAPFVRLSRRSHGAYLYGSSYPITSEDDDTAYFGVPYDPGAAIPVYGPAPSIQQIDPPAGPPPTSRLTGGMRDENQEACRSERVTVPASEGEREILVVRC